MPNGEFACCLCCQPLTSDAMSRLRKWAFQQSRPFTILLVMGVVFALIEATVWPLFSLVFAEAIATVIRPDHEASSLALWCGLMVVIGGGNVVSSYFRHLFAELAGAKLTQRLRHVVFKHIVQQSAGWFDEKSHSQGLALMQSFVQPSCIPGILTEYLAHDVTIVRHTLGDYYTVFILTYATVVFGAVIALQQCWQLALVVLGLIPLVMIATMLSNQAGLHFSFVCFIPVNAFQGLISPLTRPSQTK